MFHRVIFFLAALTRRLFRSILGADDALFGAVMGTRGATYSAAGAEGVRATGGLSSASGTPTVSISASELDFSQLRSIDLLYAPQLHHVTSCCINRFRSPSRIDMPL